MKTPIIVFGAGEAAQVAHFYLRHDSDFEVKAFTVDSQFLQGDQFDGLPLLAFEDVDKTFPAAQYGMLVAVGYNKLNSIRAQKYQEAKARGYHCISYVSSRASVWPGLDIGENCFIYEDNTIQPFVKIGNNVVLWSGNHIGHHAQIGDNCFLTSHVVVSGGVQIGDNCFIGVNATIRDHVRIGERCVIGAGSLIVKDAEAGGVYSAPASERSPVPSHRLRGI